MAYLLYSLLALVALRFYWYDISPDQISYLNIASLYAGGAWAEAVNGFWSPLLSWAIALLSPLGLSAWAASKIVSFAAGLLMVFAFGRVATVFNLPVRSPVHLIAAIFTAFAAMRTSADLLAAALLLLYFSEVWRDRWRPLPLGMLGGLLYFAKNYLLFFFLLHFALTFVLRWWRNRPEPAPWRAFALALTLTFAIAGCWIAVLTAKYGSFTASRAGAVNLRMVGPESSGYRQHKVLSDPSSPHAYSTLQDPPPQALPSWTPASAEGLRQILRLLKKNLNWLEAIFHQQTIFWMAILVLYIAATEFTPGKRWWFDPILAVLLVPSGYLVVIVIDRYLWATWYLFLLMGATALTQLTFLSRWTRRGLALAGAVSFLFAAVQNFRNTRGSGELEWRTAEFFRATLPPETKTLSCGAYESSLIVSYHRRAHYYGIIRESADDRQYARELNPNFDASSARLLPAVPADISSRLEQIRPNWLMVWPRCEGIPPEVAARIAAKPVLTSPDGVQLFAFQP